MYRRTHRKFAQVSERELEEILQRYGSEIVGPSVIIKTGKVANARRAPEGYGDPGPGLAASLPFWADGALLLEDASPLFGPVVGMFAGQEVVMASCWAGLPETTRFPADPHQPCQRVSHPLDRDFLRRPRANAAIGHSMQSMAANEAGLEAPGDLIALTRGSDRENWRQSYQRSDFVQADIFIEVGLRDRLGTRPGNW